MTLGGCEAVHTVVVYRRTGSDVAWNDDRDIWYHDLFNSQSSACEPEWVSTIPPDTPPPAGAAQNRLDPRDELLELERLLLA